MLSAFKDDMLKYVDSKEYFSIIKDFKKNRTVEYIPKLYEFFKPFKLVIFKHIYGLHNDRGLSFCKRYGFYNDMEVALTYNNDYSRVFKVLEPCDFDQIISYYIIYSLARVIPITPSSFIFVVMSTVIRIYIYLAYVYKSHALPNALKRYYIGYIDSNVNRYYDNYFQLSSYNDYIEYIGDCYKYLFRIKRSETNILSIGLTYENIIKIKHLYKSL